VASVKTDVDMKKNIKKAQMGGAYASRRAYKGQPSSTKSSKEDQPSSPKVTTIKSKPSKATQDYRLYSESEIDNYTPTSREPEKRKVTSSSASTPAKAEGNKGGTSNRQRAAVTTSKANTPAPNRQQKITPTKGLSPIALPERKKPTVAREYSESERKIMSIMNKGKQADGTMSTSAQAKIAATRAKERAEKMKAERKENRAGNKSNKATNKTISRISKVNKKPKK